ncbi:MAG: hypothetical protein KAZ71_07310 [Bacteroidia bacterium]|nr:hypothetical protein [Bacteroidia bacterium]
MKKIILLASVITVASFASCKKAATCECTTTVTGQSTNGTAANLSGYSNTTVTTKEISKTSKKTAAAMCGNGETTQTTTSTFGSTTNTQVQTSSTTCAIK